MHTSLKVMFHAVRIGSRETEKMLDKHLHFGDEG